MVFQDWHLMKTHCAWGHFYLLPLLMPLKPSDVTFGCVSSECSMDRAQLQGSKPFVCLGTVTGFSDWAVDGRRAQCTRLLIIPGVQTPGSRIS